MQQQFAQRAKEILEKDESVIGLAVAGSWLTHELDEFSDLDLIIVIKTKITGDKNNMLAYAKRLGKFLSGFTGEHVGEPRLLICMFDDPLLHVDLKFVTLEEFRTRVETPVILFERDKQLQNVLNNSTAKFPYPDYQWIEDRFWTWVHYSLVKIGRGEYLDALDSFGFLRVKIFGPLLHIKNKQLPRGVRKAEMLLQKEDLDKLLLTLGAYNREALLQSLKDSVKLYRELRNTLYDDTIILRTEIEEKVMDFFSTIGNRKN